MGFRSSGRCRFNLFGSGLRYGVHPKGELNPKRAKSSAKHVGIRAIRVKGPYFFFGDIWFLSWVAEFSESVGFARGLESSTLLPKQVAIKPRDVRLMI